MLFPAGGRELVSVSPSFAFGSLCSVAVYIPKQRVDLPPGGAESIVVGRSVRTFPEFWCAPHAKALDDTGAAAVSILKQMVDLPPCMFAASTMLDKARIEYMSVTIKTHRSCAWWCQGLALRDLLNVVHAQADCGFAS